MSTGALSLHCWPSPWSAEFRSLRYQNYENGIRFVLRYSPARWIISPARPPPDLRKDLRKNSPVVVHQQGDGQPHFNEAGLSLGFGTHTVVCR